MKELEEQYAREKEESARQFEKQRRDYESKIATLQEQVERHSMMSSMTPDDFDEEETFGELKSLECFVFTKGHLMLKIITCGRGED